MEKPIGEAVLQIDMMLGKERKVSVRGETFTSLTLSATHRPEPKLLHTRVLNPRLSQLRPLGFMPLVLRVLAHLFPMSFDPFGPQGQTQDVIEL